MGEFEPLGEYVLVRPVGKGSYGEVSLVRHRTLGKQFVIKKLNLQNASRRERKAAEQEAQLLSRLKHPNIVAYRESWEGEDGMLYIVMGFCEGGDLYHKLKEQKGKLLLESQVMDWFIQIAMALQYLHEEHIMHRDLKTQNVFLTRSNIIKVGDLGIARVLESQYDMASTLIGTPYYMSPELFSNKPYNYKSDVWALGCCVYEIATLRHAFNAKDMNSLVYRIIEGKLPPMPKDYTKELGDLIAAMLNRQPEKRPSVKQILHKSFIRHHITLFLQATKLNHCKPKKKVSDSSLSNISANREAQGDALPKSACDPPKKIALKKMRSPAKNKPAIAAPLASDIDVPETALNCLNHTGVSVATLSNVDINISPSEGDRPAPDHPIPAQNPANDHVTNKPKWKRLQIESHTVEGTEKVHLNSISRVEKKHSGSMEEQDDTMKLLQPVTKNPKSPSNEELESTDKLLEPFVPVMELASVSAKPAAKAEQFVCPAPQPHSSVSEPSLSRQRRHRSRDQKEDDAHKEDVAHPRPLPIPPASSQPVVQHVRSTPEIRNPAHGTSLSHGRVNSASQEHRPLSARERRRLKQSQEDIFASAPAVTRSSCGTQCGNETPAAHHPDALPEGKQKSGVCRRLSEDEWSSSASSTERSEGECKEGRWESSEMQDLVELMTETLHVERSEGEKSVPPSREFRPQRKYRDTLILHGKAPAEPEELHFHGFPSDTLTVPEKFRRMVEALRADVVQGVGVKLLETVYDIMECDDETDREVQLKDHLGDKYTPYSLKIRQLKFFEDNSKF
ncbi:NIMA-related kinase 4 S homeolog [Xenopus laevis]|uniref:Serine/threonine-protein kinase Nek4 n=1 Tax=Xenopus laevis TaxID=8355 RepID=Q6NU24_XENLA|nr:NIMA-related kinase 4 S homeolog [Xenopus laevis]AAH68778.1 MGC81305 protein [Xenopus laevis]